MKDIFEGAFVIARRDFVATVFRRSFILFLLAPVALVGLSLLVGMMAASSDRESLRDTVAVTADGETFRGIEAARQALGAGIPDQLFPVFRQLDPEENEAAQAQALLSDTEANYSAVLSGTFDRPVLTGPARIEGGIGRRIQLLLDQARRTAALESVPLTVAPVQLQRVVVQDAVGSLRPIRRVIAQGGQTLIFFVTLTLATMLLSNLVEEKSSKVIEVLAAAVPLDAVFFGKLFAMLAMSLVGLVVWGGLLAVGYLFFQVLADWITLPQAGPAIGWPAFALLLLLYYTMNYMLLGALFLGIGGQASSVREVQTLSMPITFLQVMVLVLAMTVLRTEGGLLTWVAYIFPLSSPLSMIALAAQSNAVWPHLLALAWQAIWVVVIVRLSSRLFRHAVLKSGGGGPLFSFARRKVAPQPAE